MYTCPVCNECFKPQREPSFSLPPTGKDYDWCDTSDVITCSCCESKLQVMVRLWLDSKKVEVQNIVELPPPPDPFCAVYEFNISPDGTVVAVRPLSGASWCFSLDEGRSQLLPFEGWVRAWSQDGTQLLTDKGDVRRLTDGTLVAILPKPYERTWSSEPSRSNLSFRFPAEIRSALFAPEGNAILVDSYNSIDGKCSAIDLVPLDGGKPKEFTVNYGSGNRDGSVFFAPDGKRILHTRANTYGGSRFVITLLGVDTRYGLIDQPFVKVAEREYDKFDIQSVVWLKDGGVLVVYGPGSFNRQLTGYGLRLLSEDNLETLADVSSLELPRSPRAKPTFQPAVAERTDGEIILVTSAVHLVRRVGSDFVHQKVIDSRLPGFTAAAIDPSGNTVVANAREEIYIIDIDTGATKAVGRELAFSLKLQDQKFIRKE